MTAPGPRAGAPGVGTVPAMTRPSARPDNHVDLVCIIDEAATLSAYARDGVVVVTAPARIAADTRVVNRAAGDALMAALVSDAVEQVCLN